jgi:hypothetical protein
MNLIEGIQEELARNRELLAIYQSLPGGAGVFGAVVIDRAIKAAEEAMATGDTVAMIQAYKMLESTE